MENNEVLKNIKFLDSFGKKYKEESDKLPYHINVIEELHADENAHSRIFAKLLQYSQGGKYIFLDKFIRELCGFDIPTDKLEIGKVDSHGRIDLPIYDGKYFIIIENKINYASEQNTDRGGQLARYIESLKNSYNLENIYIIYTTRNSEEPSDEIWKNSQGESYKEEFKNRYKSISYRDDIYRWLKEEVNPHIYKKDKYLDTALEQYIDYLDGMFKLRTIQKNMNMELQELIKKELGIGNMPIKETNEILSKKIEDLDNLKEQIRLLYTNEITNKYFAEWENELKQDFEHIKHHKDPNVWVGAEFNIESKNFLAMIEVHGDSVYVGIHRYADKKHEQFDELKPFLEANKLNSNDSCWYGYKKTNFENAYEDLKKIIKSFTNE